MSNISDYPPRPRVVVTLAAWQQIQAYVDSCPLEINGFGLVTQIDEIFLIDRIFMLDQSVTMASADTDPAALHRMLYQLTREGIDAAKVRFQWHSHVNGPAYCSSVDLATIERTQGEFLISLVTNKRGEVYCRLDLFKPIRVGFELELEILIPPLSGEVLETLRDEVGRRVSTLVPRRLRTSGRQSVCVEAVDTIGTVVPLSTIAQGQ